MDHANISSCSASPKTRKLLKLAAHYLRLRDFSSCRKLALQARHSDPNNSGPDQILAVADVLLAADNQNPTDWYSILQIPRPGSENPTLIRIQFEKLKALLEPSKNRFDFSPEAFELVQKAWSALGPEKKTHFANGSRNAQESTKQREEREEIVGNERNGKGHNVGGTFWTVCPYCYYMFEYEKVYENVCLRCQNCRKAFHGVAIKAPSPDILVPGKEQYNFCFGVFRMEYTDPNEKKNTEAIHKKDINVVVISDDDDADVEAVDCYFENEVFEGMHEEVVKIGSEGVVGNGIGGSGGAEAAELRSEGKTPVKRVKTLARRVKSMKSKSVASSTKKVMGNGMRSRRIELMDGEKVDGVDMNVEDGDGNDEGSSGSGSGMAGVEFF